MSGHSFHNKRRTAWLTAIILSLPLLSLTGCDGSDQQTLPKQMVGVWKTDDPRYKNRYMNVEVQRITFGMGGTSPDRPEFVDNVKTSREHPSDYIVKLKMTDGSPDSITLQYAEQNGGELRLKSQPKIVWTRNQLPVKKVAEATGPEPAPTPTSTGLAAPKVQTLTPDRIYGDHVTIYRIDCLKPHTCKSY